MARNKSDPGYPSRKDIIRFIREAEGHAGKREIAKAFNIKADGRIQLKEDLRALIEDGTLSRQPSKGFVVQGELPPVTVLDVFDRDTDGELLARPMKWESESPPPKIYMAPERGQGRGPAIGIGDRVLARINRLKDGTHEARVIKKLGLGAQKILGVYRKDGKAARIYPVDKRAKSDLLVDRNETNGAKDGELVLAELMPAKGHATKLARVVERLCDVEEPKAVSLIAIHAHGIPNELPSAVLAEADAAQPAQLGKRTDLRGIPFITIDPSDARDHDDAVHAEADDDPKNEGGHIVRVAIADVAAYIRPGTAMDREALKRGNSVYFPDRVVPMLPERISNDLCSLREGEDRACMCVEMVFDKSGAKRRHKFMRGFMRSTAKLSYVEAQAAIDGAPGEKAAPILESVLRPLWNAYEALAIARDRRGPLDLDLPERKIELDEKGRIASISNRMRLDAHRLIEECMIQANVCAAETLEQKRSPLIYRVHDTPTEEKLNSLREVLASIDLSLAKGQVMKPTNFNTILARAKDTEFNQLVNDIVLRSQSQAVYTPENLGHFGLNLRRYAHFTSPIRRYADLIVHRALVRAHDFGKDGLTDVEADKLAEIAEEISNHERRAMAAERDSVDRYLAAYMHDQVGETFHGRISGVTRFGLFVRLPDSGADGLVPIATLGNEYFFHDEATHALVGDRSRKGYRLGDIVEVRLREATPLTGGLRFELLSDPKTISGVSSGGRPRGKGPKDRKGGKPHGSKLGKARRRK